MGSNKMFLYLAIAFSAPALSLSCSEKQLDAAQMGFRWWQISSASCNSKLLLSYLHLLIRHFHLARVLWQITWFNHNMLFREFLTTLILNSWFWPLHSLFCPQSLDVVVQGLHGGEEGKDAGHGCRGGRRHPDRDLQWAQGWWSWQWNLK